MLLCVLVFFVPESWTWILTFARSVSLSRPAAFAVSSFQDIRKFLDGIYVSEKGNVVKE